MSEKNSEAKPYCRGEPVAPSVKALREAFPDLKPDQIVTYEEISEVIKEPHRASRFWTVVGAWKESLRQQTPRVFLRTLRTAGFQCMTEAEVVGLVQKKANKAAVETEDGVDVSLGVDTTKLDQICLAVHMHSQRMITAMAESNRSAMAEFKTALPKCRESIHRPMLPEMPSPQEPKH